MGRQGLAEPVFRTVKDVCDWWEKEGVEGMPVSEFLSFLEEHIVKEQGRQHG